MKKFSKPLKLIIGVLLLPTTVFIFLSCANILWILLKNYKSTFYLLLGGLIYLFLHKFVYKFSRLYVVAHEAAHAIVALLCGHKVSDMKIGEESGSVKVSGVNAFILLAPYAMPVMVFCIIFIYLICSLFSLSVDGRIFIFMFGFFITHHLAYTYKALTETEQSDIKTAGGSIFSFSVIVLANAVIIVLLLELLFPGMLPIWRFAGDVFAKTVKFWADAAKYFYDCIIWIMRK
ncbi:MAG: M50 family metallopeptidase [Elusimicrobiota bacterium]|jgi:hypothetical protein|nr:M50 family metallopeptidase [Elusimicrobiota bacterium]